MSVKSGMSDTRPHRRAHKRGVSMWEPLYVADLSQRLSCVSGAMRQMEVPAAVGIGQ